jgi:hypothetical protein
MVKAKQEKLAFLNSMSEIANIALKINGKELKFDLKDIKELIFDEDSPDEEELLEIVDSKQCIKSRSEFKDNNWLNDIDSSEFKKGIELTKELELLLVRDRFLSVLKI